MPSFLFNAIQIVQDFALLDAKRFQRVENNLVKRRIENRIPE